MKQPIRDILTAFSAKTLDATAAKEAVRLHFASFKKPSAEHLTLHYIDEMLEEVSAGRISLHLAILGLEDSADASHA